MLYQLFGTGSQKTSTSLLILLFHLVISHLLRWHSPPRSNHECNHRNLQAILSWFYTVVITWPKSSPVTIEAPCCLLSFGVLGFWPDTGTKRDVWLLWTWFDKTPVNKLVFQRDLVGAEKFWKICNYNAYIKCIYRPTYTCKHVHTYIHEHKDIQCMSQCATTWGTAGPPVNTRSR